MSDELYVNAGLRFSKGNESLDFQRAVNRDVAGYDNIKKTQAIQDTTAEVLSLGDIGTAGYAWFYHTGVKGDGTVVTDTISLRNGLSGADFVLLKPGDIAVLRLATNTPYAIASSTNLPVLQYGVIEA